MSDGAVPVGALCLCGRESEVRRGVDLSERLSRTGLRELGVRRSLTGTGWLAGGGVRLSRCSEAQE
jgi:hypothetical protein